MSSYNKENLLQCAKPDDVFEWLRNPEQLQKCLDKIDELIDTID